MHTHGTSGQLFSLSTGTTDNPALVQGSPLTFSLNTLPDRAPGGLAYYIPAFLATFTVTITQAGTGGTAIEYDKLPSILLDSVNLYGCWHGTPISPNFVKGVHLPIIEYIQNGFRYAERKKEPLGATGTYTGLKVTIALHPACNRLGSLENDTAPLAAMLRGGQLTLNIAPNSVLATHSVGATLTGNVRVSAVLVPRNEIVLATPIETVLHTQVAGASDQVQIRGFGCDSGLVGIQKKGGVLHAGLLTSSILQGGSFLGQNVTQFNFPWRNQFQNFQPEAFVDNMFNMMPPSRPQTMPVAISGGDSETASFPFTAVTNNNPAQNISKLVGLLEWPLVFPGWQVRLSDLQTADSDKEFYLTVTGGFSGTHNIVAQYAKAWNPSMIDSFLTLVTSGGSNSLAAHVLGPDYTKSKMVQRLPKTKTVTTDDNLAYLPWQLLNAA